MRNFNKTNLLDQCINGNPDNLSELLDSAFDQFNVFYALCKDYIGSKNIDAVSYKGISDGSATFQIMCPKKFIAPEITEIISPKLASHEMQSESIAHGLSFNIFIKE